MKHDLQYSIDLPIWLGEVRVTNSDQIVNVVFDTASDWLVVPDENCQTCKGAKITNSSSRRTSTTSEMRKYSTAELKGYTFVDKVCLKAQQDSCLDKFKYYGFTEQQGMDFPIEGILGMSQNKQMRVSTQEQDIGPLFVYELFRQKQIPSPTFSFAYQQGYTSQELSFVDIGEP